MALIIWPMGSRTDYRLTLVLRQNTSLDPVTVAARGCGAKNVVSPGSCNRPGGSTHRGWGNWRRDAAARLESRCECHGAQRLALAAIAVPNGETLFSRVRRSQRRGLGVRPRRALRGSQMSAQRRRFILAAKYAHSLQLGHNRADEIGKRVREECR